MRLKFFTIAVSVFMLILISMDSCFGNGCQVSYGHYQTQNYHQPYYQSHYQPTYHAIATTFNPIPVYYPSFIVGYGDNYELKERIKVLEKTLIEKSQAQNITVNVTGSNSDEKLFQQFKAFMGGMQPVNQSQNQNPQPQNLAASPPSGKGIYFTECIQCHSNQKSSGGFNVEKLTCESIANAMEEVLSGRMPLDKNRKPTPFDANKNGDFVKESIELLKKYKK